MQNKVSDNSPKCIEVAYASDNRFVPILMTSIASMLDSNSDYKITIHLMSDGIDKNNVLMLRHYIEDKKQKLMVYELTDNTFKGSFNLNKDWPRAAVIRLNIQDILPDSLDKILYLDCDTIVCSNLIDLWNFDIGSNLIAGVEDCMDNNYKESIKIHGKYINSGVILYDLKAMRKSKIGLKIDELMMTMASHYKYPDQDLINAAFAGKICTLPLKYNVLSQIYAFKYEDYLKYRDFDNYYNCDEFQYAVSNPVIIHFSGGFAYARPWYTKCKHPCKMKFLKYYRKANMRLNYWGKDNRSKSQKMIAMIYYSHIPFRIELLSFFRKINNKKK